ncbi:hypothetical protein RB213_003625 [Colletotrichum asianum]
MTTSPLVRRVKKKFQTSSVPQPPSLRACRNEHRAQTRASFWGWWWWSAGYGYRGYMGAMRMAVGNVAAAQLADRHFPFALLCGVVV